MALLTVVEMVFQKADLKDLWASMTVEKRAEQSDLQMVVRWVAKKAA